jgi:hypothetical protein
MGSSQSPWLRSIPKLACRGLRRCCERQRELAKLPKHDATREMGKKPRGILAAHVVDRLSKLCHGLAIRRLLPCRNNQSNTRHPEHTQDGIVLAKGQRQ